MHTSASPAHAANAPVGLALPAEWLRALWGNFGRCGATVRGIRLYDLSAARVELTGGDSQPRSALLNNFAPSHQDPTSRRTTADACLCHQPARVRRRQTRLHLTLPGCWPKARECEPDYRQRPAQPCATDIFGIDAREGLSEVLGGQLSLQQAIVRLDPAGLYLLPGGQARDDVADLLSGPTFARLIMEARRMFDYIIIDAPPLGIFTDANVLLSRADAALLVVRSGKTRYSMVDKLLEQLPRERILGVVLNRADEPSIQCLYYRQRYYRPNDDLAAVTPQSVRQSVKRSVQSSVERITLQRPHRSAASRRGHGFFGAIMAAVFLRLGVEDAQYELFFVGDFSKLDWPLFLSGCILSIRSLRFHRYARSPRTDSAVGAGAWSRWIALAISFYVFPQLMLGRGIS